MATSNDDIVSAQVHRFRDRVALYTKAKSGAAIVYLTTAQAQDIVNALNAVITEIAVNEVPFASSKVGTWSKSYLPFVDEE